MATVILTIGVRANDDVNIASVAGTGPYTVTLAAPPAASTVIGDVLSDEAASPKIFLITGISGSDLTVTDVLGASAAPSAAGSSQAFTRRAYADYNLANAILDDTTLFAVGDTAALVQCEEITLSNYPADNQAISGGGTRGLIKIDIYGHANYRYTAGAAGAGDAGLKDTDGRCACLTITTPVPTEVHHLVVQKAGTIHNSNSLIEYDNAAGSCEVHHNLIFTNALSVGDATDYLAGVRYANASPGTLKVHNNAIWGIKNATDGYGYGIMFGYAGSNSWAHQNTVVNSHVWGISASSVGVVLKNNIVLGSGTADYLNASGWGTCSNNCSSDTTAPGTTPPTIKSQVLADILVDGANGDLHLTVGSNALAAGVDLTGSATTIGIDIDGETRSAPWDMGADFTAPPPLTFSITSRDYEMGYRQVSTATYPVSFFMADETDLVTGEAGVTCTVQIRKPGGAFAAAVGAVTEVGQGVYSWAGNATDRNTLGDLDVRITGTGCAPTQFKLAIVTHDPFDESGGGGTATLANQTTMITHLTDIKGSAFFKETHALDKTTSLATAVDAVWDENIVTAHGTGSTSGLLLRALGSLIASRTYNANLNDLLGVPDQVNATVVTEAGGAASSDAALMLSTSLATVASQTSMTLTTGSTDNDCYTNCLAILTDQSTATQKATVRITDYVGATRTATLEAAPAFVVVAGDSISIKADQPAQLSTTAVAAVTEAVLEDDVSLRTTDDSLGQAVSTLSELGKRTYNANLNALLGVADQEDLTAVRSNYFCRHKFIRDGQADMDEYSCIRWWKDDTPLTSGVTSPTIRVIHGKTGADLIPQTALSEAGSSHLFYHESTSARITAGQAYSVVYRATIDGLPRVSEITIGRDVS